MSLTHDETTTYIGDAIDTLNERLEAFNDATTMVEFTDAIDECKTVIEDQVGYLEQAKSAIEDQEFLDEYAGQVADDLEAGTDDACADLSDEFREGFEAAIQWIRDNY